MTATPKREGLIMAVASMMDEQGNAVALESLTNFSSNLNFSVPLATNVQTVDATFRFKPTHVVEFVAKPTPAALPEK